MFDFFKNMFSGTDQTELRNAISIGALLVDVRTAGEFAGGSVKGAVNIPLDQVEKQISKFRGKKAVVVFCRSGNRSAQAKSLLTQNGIPNVINGGTWTQVDQILKEGK